jgi:hypothetical protein
MESRASKATALLWKAYPLTQEFALTNEEVRFSVAYATGQRLDIPDRYLHQDQVPSARRPYIHLASDSMGPIPPTP